MPLIKNRIESFVAERSEAEAEGWPAGACKRDLPLHRLTRRTVMQEWERVIPLVLAKFAQALLASRVENLEREVEALRARLDKGGAQRSIIVPIESFAPEPFEVIKPFHVVVEPADGEFIASLYDANINASGETEEEAVADLKDMMLTLFERLQQEPEQALGVGPKRQLAVLKSLVRKHP
jgi:predicted RNase H-like HicB family nuclease